MHCGHGIPELRVRDAADRAIGNTTRILEEAIGTEGWDEKKDKLGHIRLFLHGAGWADESGTSW